MQYRDSDKPVRDIARELGIDALVEISLQRMGDSVRSRAQLIDGRTEEPLWTQSFNDDLRNIVVLEREVTRAIVDEIDLALTPAIEARLAGARPVNPEAYEAYLRGKVYWDRLTPEDAATAVQYFRLALETDPDYALAYVGVVHIWGLVGLGLVPPPEGLPTAGAAAAKAIELDSTLAEAHHMLANIRTWFEWDWAGADTAFRRAIALNQNYPDARAYYSLLLMLTGRPEQGMAQIERAMELDPVKSFFQGIHGGDLTFMGRYDEAIAQLRKSVTMVPAHRQALWRALHLAGMWS